MEPNLMFAVNLIPSLIWTPAKTLTYITHSYFVLSLLIPHCHGNGLVMVGYICNICVII